MDKDPVLEATWGEDGYHSHTFEVRWPKETSRGRCPVSRQWSTNKLCPVCHRQINPMNGVVKDVVFSLIGAMDSGKSSYIAALIPQLNGSSGARFGLSAGSIGETSNLYYELYRPLAGRWNQASKRWDVRVIKKTQEVPNRNTSIQPLVYEILLQGASNRAGHGVTLSLFDPPGEGLTGTLIEKYHNFVYNSAGLTLLIDGELLLDPGKMGAKLAQSKETLDAVIAKVKAHRRVRPYVAIAVSKADLLQAEGLLPDDFWTEPEHLGGYDEASSRKHSAEIERLFLKGGGHGLVNTAKNAFGSDRVRFFAFSAFGRISIGPSGDPLEEINPIRVTEPLMWLMAKSGLIPTKQIS